MTDAKAERRYYPGPHPDDTSESAFSSEYECRYDVMPEWYWDFEAREVVYRKWKARKEAEKFTRLNAKRVFDMIGEAAGGEPGE